MRNFLEDNIESAQTVTRTHTILLKEVMDLEFNGDRYRLDQVMQNLLSMLLNTLPKAQLYM